MNWNLLKSVHYQKYNALVIILLLIFIIIGLACIQSVNGTKGRIVAGEIQYSKEIGWINWGHAKPERTLKAFKELQDLNRNSADTFLFCYSQKMKFKLPAGYLVAEFKECRKIKPHLSAIEEKSVFKIVFISVSESFEKMQADFPYILSELSRSSSFRDGDLNGNLLSLHSALSGFTADTLIGHLGLLNPSESALKYDLEKIGKNRLWNINNERKQSDIGEKLNRFLNEGQIQEVQSSIVSQTEKLYFE